MAATALYHCRSQKRNFYLEKTKLNTNKDGIPQAHQKDEHDNHDCGKIDLSRKEHSLLSICFDKFLLSDVIL